MVQVAVVNVCYGNMPGELYPLSGNDPNGNAWTWDSDGNGLTLLNAMPTCSYLYYFGHGTKNSFGIGPWNPAKPNSTNNIWWNDLAAAELQYYLGNWNGTVVPYNATPYKLVFIDGCQSGAGGLPQAFGIPSKQYSTNDFKAAGIRSRAFVGYTEPVTINILNIDGYQDALQAFWTNWFYGHSVHDMVTNSQSAAIFGLGNTMSSSAVIYGATDMFIGSP
jgi:hypothetical protein